MVGDRVPQTLGVLVLLFVARIAPAIAQGRPAEPHPEAEPAETEASAPEPRSADIVDGGEAQNQTHGAGGGLGCADIPGWSSRTLNVADCAAAVGLVQTYLSSTEPSELRCNSVLGCCEYFSSSLVGASIDAVGDDGTTLIAGCPHSCGQCAGADGGNGGAAGPPWDTTIERKGCEDYSDTTCQLCTSPTHRSSWFGAPCIWHEGDGTPVSSRCQSCYWCSASDAMCPDGHGAVDAEVYEWMYGRHHNTNGTHQIWFKTGYREKEIITVAFGAASLFCFFLATSPPMRANFLKCLLRVCCLPCLRHYRRRHGFAGDRSSTAKSQKRRPPREGVRSGSGVRIGVGTSLMGRFRRFGRLDPQDIMDRIGSDCARYLVFQQLCIVSAASPSPALPGPDPAFLPFASHRAHRAPNCVVYEALLLTQIMAACRSYSGRSQPLRSS